MRTRIAGVLAGIAIAGTTLVGGTAAPAMAAPAGIGHSVHPAISTHLESVVFYNDGWYPAYADIYGYNENGTEIYHDWSGTLGHGGRRVFTVPAYVSALTWQVRMDPFGNTIHTQTIAPWYDFDNFCQDGKHLTMYVGGFVNSTNSYDMHCSNW